MFLPNVPGAMFIQGGTFIPESRVDTEKKYFPQFHKENFKKLTVHKVEAVLHHSGKWHCFFNVTKKITLLAARMPNSFGLKSLTAFLVIFLKALIRPTSRMPALSPISIHN